MKSFVDKHNELSKHVEKLETIFSFPLFAFIMSSSFLICCCAFTATVLDASDSVGMIYYCLSSLFQVYFLCYYGQMLQTSSENLNQEVYNCGWENIKNPELRYGLILIIRRSQKPKVLTIMKFADITMQHFASVSFNVFKSNRFNFIILSQVVTYSYSYFTLLRRLYSKT
jgi:hypothetical protein